MIFGFFGRPKLIFLNSKMPEGNYSYHELRRIKNCVNRNPISWLIRANIGILYIELIRKISYFPVVQKLFAKIENRFLYFNDNNLFNPKLHNPVVRESVFSKNQIEDLKIKALSFNRFKSPYASDKTFNLKDKLEVTSLWNFEEDFLQLSEFINVICNKDLIKHCEEILGSKCSVSWAWLWHTFPGKNIVNNQLWHRDSSEPLNFTRVFIPLTDIIDENDGPTEFVLHSNETLPTSTFEPRRISNEEIESVGEYSERKRIFVRAGDFYTANTFWCLHRGTSILGENHRSMLSLLVSNRPSHRTVSIPRISLETFSKSSDRNLILENRSWLRNIISF